MKDLVKKVTSIIFSAAIGDALVAGADSLLTGRNYFEAMQNPPAAVIGLSAGAVIEAIYEPLRRVCSRVSDFAGWS